MTDIMEIALSISTRLVSILPLATEQTLASRRSERGVEGRSK